MKISPVRILVIDDDEDDFFIIKEYLSKIEGYDCVVDWCPEYNKAGTIICKGEYDLYFVDYHLHVKTGLELIEESIRNNCEEPFILLTGNGSRTIDMMAMQSGAIDYLVKGELNIEKLERCIRYSLERSSAIRALRASERKFRNIFEQSKDTVFTATEDLLFTEVNDASFALLEYNKTELLSQSLYSLFADKNGIAAVKHQLILTGDITDKEVVLLTKNGEKKICILTLSTEKNIGGIPYMQGIIHDITVLKRSEKANLLLEKLNVTGRLVRMMAHEVRNPLNNIMLSAEQLDIPEHSEESKMCLNIINRNSKRIEDIIAELLNSFRPAEIMVERKSLQSIVDESLVAASDRITLRHIALKRDFLDESAWVMADNKKLQIAFLNIIINAIEAMQENEGQLVVAIKQKGLQYMVSIEDNGSGISDDNLSHLFEPYFTSKQNGMGLGLSSALNILQSHNASFDVQTKLTKGTIFRLFFNMAG